MAQRNSPKHRLGVRNIANKVRIGDFQNIQLATITPTIAKVERERLTRILPNAKYPAEYDHYRDGIVPVEKLYLFAIPLSRTSPTTFPKNEDYFG